MVAWLSAYFSVGALALAFNLYAHFLRLSGGLGEAVRDAYRRYRPPFWTIVLASFLLPPVAMAQCLVSYSRDWARFKLEDDQDQRTPQ